MRESIGMKVCSHCLTNKPLDAFYADPRYKLGVMGWCKDCKNTNANTHKAAHRAAHRPPIPNKHCRHCDTVKPADQFMRNSAMNDGLGNKCKACKRVADLPRRMTTDAAKRNHLWTHYGMRLEDLQQMLDAQKGLCAICETLLKRPTVDHCHSTGFVRALLCYRCNIHLRTLEDTVFMTRALAYLRQHAAGTVNPQFRAHAGPQRLNAAHKARVRELRHA